MTLEVSFRSLIGQKDEVFRISDPLMARALSTAVLSEGTRRYRSLDRALVKLLKTGGHVPQVQRVETGRATAKLIQGTYMASGREADEIPYEPLRLLARETPLHVDIVRFSPKDRTRSRGLSVRVGIERDERTGLVNPHFAGGLFPTGQFIDDREGFKLSSPQATLDLANQAHHLIDFAASALNKNALLPLPSTVNN